jgi:uncharacterized lipoprotein YddW (UPF0748 family)
MKTSPMFAFFLSVLAACSSDPPNDPIDKPDAGMIANPEDASDPIEPLELASIEIRFLGPSTLAVNATTALEAIGTRTDGSEIDLTSAATWSSDQVAIAEVLAGGVVRAKAAGTASLKATRGAIESNLLQITVEETPTPERTELRGVWVTRWSYSSVADLEALITDIDEANLNTIFFQVRGNGDAYYRSTLEPWASRLTGTLGEDPGWDPLAEVIRIAHAKNMKVHAWVNTFPAWSGTTLPIETTPRHPIRAHPEWLCADENGTPMPPASSGYQFFSPGNAEVRAHIANVVGELDTNYELDGIHMDFIRYPGPNYCHDAASEAAYTAALAANPGLSYDDFERDNVTLLVTELKARTRFLSVASWGIYQNKWGWSSVSQGHTDFMQDAHLWGSEGLVDALCPMIYWATTEPRGGRLDFQTLLDDHKAAADRGGAMTFAGINAELDLAEIEKEILYSRTASAAGFVLFDYTLIRDRLETLKNDVLSERVPPPKH